MVLRLVFFFFFLFKWRGLRSVYSWADLADGYNVLWRVNLVRVVNGWMWKLSKIDWPRNWPIFEHQPIRQNSAMRNAFRVPLLIFCTTMVQAQPGNMTWQWQTNRHLSQFWISSIHPSAFIKCIHTYTSSTHLHEVSLDYPFTHLCPQVVNVEAILHARVKITEQNGVTSTRWRNVMMLSWELGDIGLNKLVKVWTSSVHSSIHPIHVYITLKKNIHTKHTYIKYIHCWRPQTCNTCREICFWTCRTLRIQWMDELVNLCYDSGKSDPFIEPWRYSTAAFVMFGYNIGHNVGCLLWYMCSDYWLRILRIRCLLWPVRNIHSCWRLPRWWPIRGIQCLQNDRSPWVHKWLTIWDVHSHWHA